ncbi:MAG TPA: Stp1/IreP family PP2C-type Ser/Thr phosphatase [Burkholderiales bacterium]|nr:Stp1/IreP family PP2C-type Ser/Thr phosphatase [Burkholderiales bacterium]
MTAITLETASASHPGRVRGHNEDSISVDAHARLAVLADGMGGHNAGEVASRMAADAVSSALTDRRTGGRLERAQAEALVASQVAAANSAVFQAARAERRYDGMGTTLVVALWHEAGVTYAHVGDSRLYLLRGGELRQLTRDHSIVQEQLERGAISSEQARYSVNRNVLTRAVGIDPDVRADVHTHDVVPGDVYLLCSDGLTDMMMDREIRQTLLECGRDLELAARRLVERANEAGGFDNISVILVRAEREAA